MMAYVVTLLILVVIASMIGLALNFQWGTAGLVNFGVVGFVAIGAYVTASFHPMSAGSWHWWRQASHAHF